MLVSMAVKVEDGKSYTSSAYLVVPDPEQPSTWKLRVQEEPGKVTVAQLGRAAAALGPGFRGNKVSLSQDERAAALRKLRGLYKSHDVSPDDMPSVLQQAVHTVAGKRLRKNVKKLMAAVGDGQSERAPMMMEAMKELRAELAEDLECLQESLYLYGLSAIQGGTLSFEAVIASVQDAVDEIEDGDEEPGQDPRHNLVATFPGTAVYAGEDGGLYQVSYHMDGTEAVIEGDPIEVTAEFKPSPGGEETNQEAREHALAESQEAPLVESIPSGTIKSGKLNRQANTIEGTTLITANSSNGVNHKRKYSDRALRQIAAMAEGIPAYANHVSPDMAFKPRDVRDMIGRHVNVRYDAGTGRVLSDLQLVEHHAPWVFSLADRLGDQVGNSLVSKGLVRMEGDTEVVDEIVALRSGDLVSDPASTRGLFESQGQPADAAAQAFLTADRDIFETLAEAGEGATVVDLIFQKDLWESAALAKDWAKAHGFKADGIEEAGGTFRMHQAHRGDFKTLKTIDLARGVKPAVQAVIGFHHINQEASDMEFNAANIATHLKDNTEHLKQVSELLGFVPKADATKLQESVETVTKERDAIAKERDTLKGEVDGFKAKEAVAAKRVKLQEAIAAHDLGKSFGKVTGVVTETFVGTLMEHEDKDWSKLLDDRLALVKGTRSNGQMPRSEGKGADLSEGRETPGEGGDLHARLAAAITR